MPVKTLPRKEEATPITMRLDERVIEQLKLKARRLSFEKNEDLTYVDLIRDAVKKQWDIDTEGNGIEIDENKLVITEDVRSFWTKKDIDLFNKSEVGKMIADCLNKGYYGALAVFWLEQLELWMKLRSAAYKVLRYYKKYEDEEYVEVTRDLASIAHVISRRGSIMPHIIEPEKIITPSFGIGSNPTMDLKYLKPHIVFSTICSSIRAYQKEADTNVFKALQAAAESIGDPIISKNDKRDGQVVQANSGGFSSSDLLMAVQNICKHRLSPAYIAMNESQYCQMQTFGRDFFDNAPSLRVAMETKQYGSVWGIPILVSDRIDPDVIIVTAAPENVGLFIEYEEPRINFTDIAEKKRVGFFETCEIGICIVNDYGVSIIKTKG